MAGTKRWRLAEETPAAGAFGVGWRLMSSFRVGGVFSASGPGRLPVVLVLVAVFFCHGAFGYAHQLPPADTQAAHVSHAAGVHQSDSDQSTDRVHAGDAYFATLLALFFGTFLLLGGRGTAGAQLPVPALPKSGHEGGGLPPPRGPTLPSLQVFRL